MVSPFKVFLRLFLLIVIVAPLWCTVLLAQKKDIDLSFKFSPHLNSEINDFKSIDWEVLLNFNVAVLSGVAGNAGAE